MKILLVYSDFIRIRKKGERYFNKFSTPAFGVNYFATLLRDKGYEVIVLDSFFEYLRTDFRSPIDVVKGTRDILEKEKDVDVVGISITSPTRNRAIEIAKTVKDFNQRIKIMAGGPHVTCLQEKFIEKFSGLFDYGVIGEGDKTLIELIEAIRADNLNKVKGIIYLDKNGQICKNEPRLPLTEEELNNLPFVDYNQYLKRLPGGNLPTLSIITSRGCRYSCAFCYSPRLWQTYRAQSAERVLDEMEYLTKKYRVKNIRFQDDIFTYNKERCIRIFQGVKEKKLNFNLYMHTRFDLIDEEIIREFAQAGGDEISFGLESGSERLRLAIGKGQNIDNKKIIELCKMIKRYKLNFGLWIIFGYPGETEGDVKMTYDLLSKINPSEVICNPVQVYPYTQLFTMAEREGIYKIEDWLGYKKEDFFTYFRGEKAIEVYKNCIFFTNHFSKIKNRQFKSGLFFSI